jgi:glycosyltransferase involved in cell wall biosynthesis
MSTRIPRPAPALDLHTRLRTAPPGERRALLASLAQVVATLTRAPAPTGRVELLGRFEELLAPADPSVVWLTLSVLEGELATADDVRRAVRIIRLDGVPAAFGTDPARTARTWVLGRGPRPDVRVVSGEVLVDVDHTARTGLATGIQRVARETVKRWVRDHDDVRLVGWGRDHHSLRLLDENERRKALTGEGTTRVAVTPPVVVVPWEATYLLPELSPERPRNERIAALAQFARCRTGVIGFDCVPISTAETTAMGVSEAFATNLAAVRHMDHVSAISEAAATEYRGWRTMLPSVGSTGPEISADLLPIEAPDTTPEHVAEAQELLTVPGLPMVLCVGTHEPRKNHLALLHASELLWREGLRFSLVLVGGRSWSDERFQHALAGARARNRPVETVRTLSDDGLWAAYRLARCMVFPSLNEGYGLPVAEALACGTPVVTSGYGSMAEIAAAGGALLVDPRDDRSIAAAMRTLLTDDEAHASLAAAAAARPGRSWDEYAEQVWAALVD